MFKNVFGSAFYFLIIVLFFTSSCEKTEIQDDTEDDTGEVFIGIEGKYTGGWTSTTPTASFTNYPISGIFRYSNSEQTKMKADFYVTDKFKSCCNLENDGTMFFEISGDSIKNFYFDDKIVDCEGTFRGEGKIFTNGNLVIDFTGNDCDGDHVGTMVFRKFI